jgi:hypothetical protein
MINAVQLLLLLPLIGAYLPTDVYDFIVSMSFSLFNFGFLQTEERTNLDYIINYVDFEQNNEYLEDIGIGSGNSVVNIMSLMTIAILLPIEHLVIYFIHWLYNKAEEPEQLCLYKLCTKVYSFFMLDIYVRFLYEIFLFLMLV